jgi:hypothetical protein
MAAPGTTHAYHGVKEIVVPPVEALLAVLWLQGLLTEHDQHNAHQHQQKLHQCSIR